MTIPVETTSGQGRSVFLYSLLKASSKCCLLVIAPGVWQPHLVFLLGSWPQPPNAFGWQHHSFLQLSGDIWKDRCEGMEKCGRVRIQLSCLKAAHTWDRNCIFTTEINLCSSFGWAEREARIEAEAWSCVLCRETTLKGCVWRWRCWGLNLPLLGLKIETFCLPWFNESVCPQSATNWLKINTILRYKPDLK